MIHVGGQLGPCRVDRGCAVPPVAGPAEAQGAGLGTHGEGGRSQVPCSLSKHIAVYLSLSLWQRLPSGAVVGLG